MAVEFVKSEFFWGWLKGIDDTFGYRHAVANRDMASSIVYVIGKEGLSPK